MIKLWVPPIKSMGGWNDDEFSAQEFCETASATGGSADTIKFKWDSDPCQRQSVTKCRSIYFRYNILDINYQDIGHNLVISVPIPFDAMN